MRIVQALHWLRDALTDPDDHRRIMGRLRAILADKDQEHSISTDLAIGLPTLPAWMQDLVRQLLAEDGHAANVLPRSRKRNPKGKDARP